MKLAMLLVPFAALTGCSAPATSDGEAGSASAEAAATFDPTTVVSREAMAGEYLLKFSAGPADPIAVTFTADGNVEGILEGKPLTATFTVPQPGRVCFDHVSTGDAPHCWRNAPAAPDGSWIAAVSDGTTVEVTPVD